MIQLPPYDVATEADQVPGYDYTIQLEGETYRIVLRYRERQDRWYLTIYDADDEVLLNSIKLSVDTWLLYRYQIEGLPPGDLICIDTSGAGAECGYADLGNRCELIYATAAEVTEINATDDASYTVEVVP